MTAETARLATWLEFVADLLLEPLTEFPYERIRAQMVHSFDIEACSWCWREADGRAGFDPGPVLREEWKTIAADWPWPDALGRHPLLHWFAATGDPRPFTIGRVPEALVPKDDRAFTDAVLRPLACEEQLSVPYALDGVEHRAFVLARTDADFDEVDLAVARRLQPLLIALNRQSRLLSTFVGPVTPSGVADHLTGRETAVLALLVRGHTAAGIAARLTMSPRTASKHIEHIYRKLGVCDRLTAARAAAALGLVPDPPPSSDANVPRALTTLSAR